MITEPGFDTTVYAVTETIRLMAGLGRFHRARKRRHTIQETRAQLSDVAKDLLFYICNYTPQQSLYICDQNLQVQPKVNSTCTLFYLTA